MERQPANFIFHVSVVPMRVFAGAGGGDGQGGQRHGAGAATGPSRHEGREVRDHHHANDDHHDDDHDAAAATAT